MTDVFTTANSYGIEFRKDVDGDLEVDIISDKRWIDPATAQDLAKWILENFHEMGGGGK